MNALEELLARKLVIADGAMGSMLIAKGISPGSCPELLSVEKPAEIIEIHLAYLQAGADIVITHSFGASEPKLARCGLAGRAEELNRAAAANARAAVEEAGPTDRPRLVAGDIGPSGELLAPLGTMTAEQIEDVFYRQAQALADGGADCIIVETMSAVDEAAAAVRAGVRAGLPVIACMTFERGPAGYHTMMGTSPEEAVAAMTEAGATVVGTNCGGPIEDHIEIVRRMAAATTLPIISEPNAGMPRVEGGSVTYSHTPEDMASRVVELADAGARIIGGCCGSTPEHLAAMVDALRRAGRLD